MFMSGDQDDFDSKNELTVPLKVVREAALNLLIHRTWWSEARVPSVNIFDDRVEFMNPGAFPQGTKPEDFRKRPHSEPINEIIANALFKGGVSEGWGRGILDIYELCKEAGLPEPEYDFVQNFVCLTIRFKTLITPYVSGGGELNGGIRGGLNGGLNDGQKKTLEYICQHEGCNTKQISIGLDVPFDTIEKQIRILLKKGLIEHRGSKKTGGYYPVKQ